MQGTEIQCSGTSQRSEVGREVVGALRTDRTHVYLWSIHVGVPPRPPAILPVSSSRAKSAWLPCGCRHKDQDDSRLTEAPHGVLSTQLCGGQRKGVSQSEGRGRGRDRWQHRMSRAPDRELQWGKEKRGL